MARFNNLKNSFLSGELSPRVDGRTDLDRYFQGCAQLENFIVHPMGGASRRPGTRYVTSTPSNAAARLIPFSYSKTENYIVEVTAGAVRVINVTTLAVYSSGAGITVSGSPTLWTGSSIYEIQYAQSADVLYLVHPDYKPKKLSRTAANTFTLTDFDYHTGSTELTMVKKYPFRDRNATSTTMTLTAAATTVGTTGTITCSDATFAFTTNMLIKITHTTTTGMVRVTSNGTGSANMIIYNAPSALTATDLWEESAWSDRRGWPRTICFFESRLVMGGNLAQPDTFWGSFVNNYDHFMARKFDQDSASNVSGLNYYGANTNNDPYGFTLASQQVNQIQWLSPGKTLLIGTLGAEHVAAGSDDAQVLGPSNPGQNVETTHGSSFVQAKRAAYTVMFVQRAGQRVRELVFDFNSDAYTSEDLSLLAEHMVRKRNPENTTFVGFTPPSIRQMEYQESPSGILWCVGTDGALYGCTRDKLLQVTAWHFHKIGGYSDAGQTIPPIVRSIAVVPSARGTHDDVWMCVTRYINGGTKNYIEYMGKEFDLEDLDNDSTDYEDKPLYVDSAHFYSNAVAFSTVSGLSHLEGQVVDVLADGKVHPQETVTGGAITLDYTANQVVVGLPYTPKLKTMRIEAGAVTGTAQGQIKRIDGVTIRFYRTVNAKVGPSESKLDRIVFRPASLAQDQPTPLFTGDKKINFPSGYENDGQIMVVQDQPLPIGVAAIVARGITSE